jgi:chemotaxis protein methyltransferase CheR
MYPLCAQPVADRHLAEFTALILRRTGIRLPRQKRALLAQTLLRRLRDRKLPDHAAYLRLLQELPSTDPEWQAFVHSIAARETYLFRDAEQWTWLRHELLPAWLAERGTETRPRLRCWSAAVSTGDEAATLACCAAEALVGAPHVALEILGTDISARALERARRGAFSARAMRLAPEAHRRRHFKQLSDAPIWQLDAALGATIEYRQHNLLEPLDEAPFDLVLLKNVLIYFDTASTQQALERVCPLVRAGGYLLTGAAEDLHGQLDGFERIHRWLARRKA